ncbi:negative regulation of centriole-centriole cohesion [Trichomonas vaginalis G3]|uniref:negative regulation of centriole-centriole cohesion n=1 Tax=Trichomonas vaginalis (strain ATCC PRA-98 / G3) TaxID=412133 RepID=UPI0021E5575F|nr:negative regulation of centriole-centriole cohesion [Trichomonas vaginalis G3]KAI5509864.1 negative regulation of centriole-centriole cohesion [Trichomonas vaginalis G3]
MDNCFSKIDTKEEFIPDDKKMTLIELYIKIDNPVFGNNVKIIKKAYRTMLISVSKRSPTFFDGLTKTLQQSLNSKLSNNDFITNIAPWIDLTNDLQTLGSFLKVLTTSLTLLSPSYYQVICKTITDIVMNVIKLSSDEYKKFCDQNNTIMKQPKFLI